MNLDNHGEIYLTMYMYKKETILYMQISNTTSYPSLCIEDKFAQSIHNLKQQLNAKKHHATKYTSLKPNNHLQPDKGRYLIHQ